MSYTPYYPNGWQTGEAGATPITPAALNYMENGIKNAYTEALNAGNVAAAALPKTGGTMTGTLKTKGLNLTSGTDYGSALPSNPAEGRLFFLDADAADSLGL